MRAGRPDYRFAQKKWTFFLRLARRRRHGFHAATPRDRRLSLATGNAHHMGNGMWNDRRVIVAGGTAGFGLVLARRLSAAGARVLLVGRSGEGVRSAIAACEASAPGGGRDAAPRLHGITADLARPGEGGRVVGEGLRIFGGVDDLFFCVGRSGRARILSSGVEDLREFLDANLATAVEITQAVADEIAAARGHMVYIGSLAGKLVTPSMGPYAIAKSALAAYVDAVRLEMAPRGAHVLLVSPGPIRRDDDDPRAADAADRYADAVSRSGLPAEALRPGGGAAVRPIDPEWLAERVLAACRRRTSELVVPRSAGLLAGLIEWFPDRGRRLLARFAGRRSDG
jgi:NAD(P)-dependent dehydrogenase (short-subunit alcohol dehydrogenase family)